MRYYTQLTLEQRYQIQAVLKTVYPYTKIARVVGVHLSTISREIQPNRGRRG
jgi:IS30 family transposase